MRGAALAIGALIVLLSGAMPSHAERVAPPSAECRLNPKDAEAGPLYLVHVCATDQDLLKLAGLAVHAADGGFRAEEARFSKLRTILDVSPEVLEQLFAIAGQQDIAAEKLAEKLVEMTQAHKALIGTWLAAPDASQPEIAALIKGAREAAQAGRYEEAKAILTKASVAAETKAQSTPADAPKLFSLAATARAGLGQIALIRSDDHEASIYFEAALRLLPETDTEARYRNGEALAHALYLQGRDKDDTNALIEAIDRYRALLAANAGGATPAGTAQLRHNLGDALLRLGSRNGEVERLKDAAAMFRGTIEAFPRARYPLDWARAQQDLGAALFRLGLAVNSTARLEEAVTAFRESLKERTRTHAPLEWAVLQSSIGTALWSLGAREEGAERFEAAVAAYREGLKPISRDHTPLDWAARQNNLGAALISLAERKSSVRDLQDAVTAFHNSLEAYQDESATYYISGVRDNLDRAETLFKRFRATGKMPAER